MKLTFLGISAGKPTKERNVSALGLEFEQDNKWDCSKICVNLVKVSAVKMEL